MKIIFCFENTLCLEEKLQQKLCAHNVPPLHLLCLVSPAVLGSLPVTLALWSWQLFLLPGPGPSQISVFWSHSFQHCQNSLVKTALSPGWGGGVLHRDRAPLTPQSSRLIQATLLYLLSLFSSLFARVMNGDFTGWLSTGAPRALGY